MKPYETLITKTSEHLSVSPVRRFGVYELLVGSDVHWACSSWGCTELIRYSRMGIESRMKIFPCKASGLRFGVLFLKFLNRKAVEGKQYPKLVRQLFSTLAQPV